MTTEAKEALLQAGIDLDDAMDRFLNNEFLLERFLKKFPDDPNYATLLQALERGDCEAAFQAAHALKGVCGNLSMKRLFPLVHAQTECLRGGDLAGASELMPPISQECTQLCAAIQLLE